MALPPQKAIIPLTGGLDLKGHENVLPQTALTIAEEVDHHERGAIAKRRGYELIGNSQAVGGGAVPDDATRLVSLGDRRFAQTRLGLYEYVRRAEAFRLATTRATAQLESDDVDLLIDTAHRDSSDYAYSNGYEIVVKGNTAFLREWSTGAILDKLTVGSALDTARCIAIGDFLFFIVRNGADLEAYRSDTNGDPVFGAAITLNSTILAETGFDVTTDGATYGYVAFSRAGNHGVLRFDGVGFVDTAINYGGVGAQYDANAIHYEPNSVGGPHIIVANAAPGTAPTVASFDVALALNNTHNVGGTAFYQSRLVVGRGFDDNTSRVMWSDDNDTHFVVFDVDGTTTSATIRTFYGHLLQSKTFQAPNEISWVFLAARGQYEAAEHGQYGAVWILCEILDNSSVFDPVAWMYHLTGYVEIETQLEQVGVSTIVNPIGNLFYLGGTRSVNVATKVLAPIGDIPEMPVAFDGIPMRTRIAFTIDRGNSVEANHTVALAGGTAIATDELDPIGFPYPPVIGGLVGDVGGNLTAQTTYQYVAVYEYVDKAGNLHRSAPSIPAAIEIGANTSVHVHVLTWNMPVGVPVQVVIYRSEGDLEILYRLVTLPAEGAGRAETGPTVEQHDGDADVAINKNTILYTQGGAQLDNWPPPPSAWYEFHRNRLWAIDGVRGDLWFSKALIDGIAPEFHPSLIIRASDRNINPVAIISGDTHMVVLGDKSIGIIRGEGPNNQGNGSTFTPIELLEGTPVGTRSPRSVVKTPAGIMFYDGELGIYLLGWGARQPTYVGEEIQAELESEIIISADLLEEREEVRFTCLSGKVFVYFYPDGRWSTFAGIFMLGNTATDAAIWGRLHTVIDSTAKLHQERIDDVYQDNAVNYAMRVKTGWIKFDGLQGLNRVRNIYLLGDLQDVHAMTIKTWYDFDDEAPADSHVYTSANIAAIAGEYQLRLHLRKQQIQSLRIEITENSVDGVGSHQAAKLMALRVEWAARGRGPRLDRGRQVT